MVTQCACCYSGALWPGTEEREGEDIWADAEGERPVPGVAAVCGLWGRGATSEVHRRRSQKHVQVHARELPRLLSGRLAEPALRRLSCTSGKWRHHVETCCAAVSMLWKKQMWCTPGSPQGTWLKRDWCPLIIYIHFYNVYWSYKVMHLKKQFCLLGMSRWDFYDQ